MPEGMWWSADGFKPFYGRRRVRKLCDRIDSLTRMVDRLRSDRDAARGERNRYRQALTDIAGWENWQRPTWREIAQEALVDA